jgi:hypothetical protein
MLNRMQEREAAVAYMAILRAYARTGEVPRLQDENLLKHPRHPDVFFPELLAYASVPNLAFDVYNLFLVYCGAGLLPPEELRNATGQVLEEYRRLKNRVAAAQRPRGIAWMWEKDYTEIRGQASLLLDILGFLQGPELVKELEHALTYSDPRLKCFAATSLIRHGQEVAPGHLIAVAASPEMRTFLFMRLRGLKQEALYPERFLTQAAFAEANMALWLTWPGELGRAPEAIELMSVASADAGPPYGMLDWYLFRFCTDVPEEVVKPASGVVGFLKRLVPTRAPVPADSETNGWMAGISGPYFRKDAPTGDPLGQTFSSFEAWESMSPEEHIGDVQELLEEWRERWDESEEDEE